VVFIIPSLLKCIIILVYYAKSMKNCLGFTLLELIITVGIIGVLTAIAVPSMGIYVKNERLTSQINTLVSHLAYARNQAVTQSQQTVVCISNNGVNCSGTDWSDGWIVFADSDGNATVNDLETVLLAQQSLAGNTLTSTIGTSVIYDNRGFAKTAVGTFSLCDDRLLANLKSIQVSITGRVRQGGATSC
jgi:type IV fimbrial biogenesis protein FimT